MTYTLEKIKEPADCAKCEGLQKAKVYTWVNPARYILSDGNKKWPLCTNHSAQAAYDLKIPHRVFNPHLLQDQGK